MEYRLQSVYKPGRFRLPHIPYSFACMQLLEWRGDLEQSKFYFKQRSSSSLKHNFLFNSNFKFRLFSFYISVFIFFYQSL